MFKKRTIYLITFILMAFALIGKTQQVHADSAVDDVFVGQINYQPNYGVRVYTIDGETVSPTEKFLPHDSLWQVFKSQNINGVKYNNVGGNQWVQAQYVINFIGQVFYVPGYGIRVYQINGNQVMPTEQTLHDGTQWKVFESRVVNDVYYYNLGANQWVEAQYLRAYVEPKWDQKSYLTVSYEANYGIGVFSEATHEAKLLQYLPNASTWKIVGQRQVAGKNWYEVGKNQWVDGDYVVVGQFAESRVLGASYISQEAAGAPMGCEAASSLEALHYQGHAADYNLKSFLATMPIAANGNPYEGFGGSPYQVMSGIYQSIFPSALTPWVRRFGRANNISGSGIDGIIGHLDGGAPVVAWVTLNYKPAVWSRYNWGMGVDNAHVVTIDGYNADSLHIVDPENGVYWVKKSTFLEAYNHMKFAVAFLK
ncbi:C39 family peptidase [Xylocopilactobacillus apicola]|uniref:Peptidase C39-like domain-containing protein n=1 Tax=Xylocopilactobacillus apicola TaxID=2932184 RepID=A0AAU9DS63_9LACO|nr:C39 family peptidase [Xylocopilactobacillus apicola]BDR58058.1 hypothetical protein XA3_04990 [Xylocopilactobacillus apicola]